MILYIFSLLFVTVASKIVPDGIQPFQGMITWTVRNDNLWPLMFYFYNPCLMETGICVRHNRGPCLEYRGILASWEEGWEYEPLWPFQSKSCSFNVAEIFNMTKAGIYSIQFEGTGVKSQTETQLVTTLSFADSDYWTPRSTFYSAGQYFYQAPTSSSNILYMRKERDHDEREVSPEQEDDDVFISEDGEDWQ